MRTQLKKGGGALAGLQLTSGREGKSTPPPTSPHPPKLLTYLYFNPCSLTTIQDAKIISIKIHLQELQFTN